MIRRCSIVLFLFFAILSSLGQSVTNSIGMRLVLIEPGEFIRGFQHENGRDRHFDRSHPYSNRQDMRHEKPAHRVVISDAFEIGKTEVTVGQFKRFVEATQYVTKAESEGRALGFFPNDENYVNRFHLDAAVNWRTSGFTQTDQHPVVCVSWLDAQAFCDWISAKEGRIYRLPTEAEWEYACRAGTDSWYSWGEDPDLAYQHANVADGALETAYSNTTRYQRAVALGADDGDGVVLTAPVAQFNANPWGLHDIHGNVWEWCLDRWSGDVYERVFDGVRRQDRDQIVLVDPFFDEKTDQHAYGDWRVMRGGAWTCAPAAVRSSVRTFAEAGDASVYTGFRVVRLK